MSSDPSFRILTLTSNLMPEHAAMKFDIEGHLVRCFRSGKHRLWCCECAYFQRMLSKHREGFCDHIVVAMDQARKDDTISAAEFLADYERACLIAARQLDSCGYRRRRS
jgi:hypothetical protein